MDDRYFQHPPFAAEYLTEQGFRVVTAADGQDAIYSARHEQPDLILLDIMMPKMDGYQFLRQYRQERQHPGDHHHRPRRRDRCRAGLDLGADDYVIKPFRMRELLARIRAVLRRSRERPRRRTAAGERDHPGHSRTPYRAGQPVALTPIEFDLLAVLMRSPGQVFTRRAGGPL